MKVTEMKKNHPWLLALITLVFLLAPSMHCSAASDTDVRDINPTKVVIEDNRIIITGDAAVSMVVIVPDNVKLEKSLRFVGRNSTRANVDAREARFTVLRLASRKGLDDEAWQMSVDAARALEAGKKIGRIGYYRPEVTIKKNRITAITGHAYIYPKR